MKRSRTLKYILFINIVFSLIWVVSCSKSGTNEENPDELIAKAWTDFEAGDYISARNSFSDILSRYSSKKMEASEGLGWCYLMLNRNASAESAAIDSALQYFLDAAFLTDANAGKTIIYHAKGDYSNAIDRAEFVLSKNSNYSFSHYPSVNAYALRWIIAHSAFQLGNFAKVVEQLNILDPSKQYDPNSPDQLLDALNTLWQPIL